MLRGVARDVVGKVAEDNRDDVKLRNICSTATRRHSLGEHQHFLYIHSVTVELRHGD